MGSLFTSLLNSTSALRVYGRVFNVIQNNITNANTPGYVKQDQSIVSLPFDPAAGLAGGVLAGPMLSARSQYLEQAVRTEQEQLGSAQQKAADLSQIQALFDTTGKSGVPGALNAFFGSFSQLSVNPNDEISRQNVIDTAGQVAQAFHQNALGIASVSANVNDEIRTSAASINQIASQIAEINRHYRSSAQASQDAGLDAQLNSALESLAQVAHYTSIKSSDGTYNIYIGGQTPLVIGDHQFAISADFSNPQTAIRDAQGNDITGQLSGAGGSLGALLEEKNVTLPGYIGSLNNLAQSFADTLNTALAQGVDRNGNTPTTNLFTYNAALGAAFTLSVNNLTPDEIAAASATAPGGNGNAIAITQLAGQPTVNGFTIMQAYGNLGGQVGRDVANAQQDQAAQQDLVNQAQQQRAQASSVSLDEEAAKLLQFQQGYQAIGKLVGVLDSLTQTVIDMVQ
jgi:flagellar hook-associated protein 1 FlgK